ncbi:MAG: multicopper oxidase [Caldilineaceae bacterium]
MNRRNFIKLAVASGAVLYLSPRANGMHRLFAAALPGGTLDPLSIPKYQQPLIIPPVMPRTGVFWNSVDGYIDYYEISARQFNQQILPTNFPATTVWGYGPTKYPSMYNYPSFTLETTYRRPVRVKWMNELVDANGNYLPHLFKVDQTLHWANPPGGTALRDHTTIDPTPYTGPVPLVTHVHGAHVADHSDGYAEAWYLPAAANLPAGYAPEGTWYNYFKTKFANQYFVNWSPGSSIYQYTNDQRASTLWYHDHTLGMTRLNVYAGPAGFYNIRGGPDDLASGVLPGPAPTRGDYAGRKYYEIPIAIQDRSFNQDSSLFYPDSRALFDNFTGPYVPNSDIAPIWNPEFFGNTMVVNGRTWPYLNVEQRRYRFRLLNGCNARFLILKFDTPNLTFWQIGAEGGFLSAPVQKSELLMSPAERADVIVDFSALPVGTTVTLLNIGPDEPFGGGIPGVDFVSADVDTTGQVMQFRVQAATSLDKSTHPSLLQLPALPPLAQPTVTRQVSLNEEMSMVLPDVGPRAALLGTQVGTTAVPLMWMDAVTENPAPGATELWEIYNNTVDAHPIHVHQVQFQVENREVMGSGIPRAPEATELGYKDTVIAYPNEITRIKSKFDLSGLFVWHCHIVEHEDNEMMRPYVVGPIPDPNNPPTASGPLGRAIETFEEVDDTLPVDDTQGKNNVYLPAISNQ